MFMVGESEAQVFISVFDTSVIQWHLCIERCSWVWATSGKGSFWQCFWQWRYQNSLKLSANCTIKNWLPNAQIRMTLGSTHWNILKYSPTRSVNLKQWEDACIFNLILKLRSRQRVLSVICLLCTVGLRMK